MSFLKSPDGRETPFSRNSTTLCLDHSSNGLLAEVFPPPHHHQRHLDGRRTAPGLARCHPDHPAREQDTEYESSLVPSIVVYGFLGLRPQASSLRMEPRLPKAAPEMGVANLLCRGTRLDVKASAAHIEIAMKDAPTEPLRLELPRAWRRQGTTATPAELSLREAGVYRVSGR